MRRGLPSKIAHTGDLVDMPALTARSNVNPGPEDHGADRQLRDARRWTDREDRGEG
jgi:hypothetical protein